MGRFPMSAGRACAALLFLLGAAPAAQAVCFVNGGAGGATHDGTSWAKAYTSLQAALGNAACSEVWVAKGVYKPTATADRTISFGIGRGRAVYGGFAGTEKQRAERVPGANPSILSGDIDNNDTGSSGVDADPSHIVGGNSYHVVLMDGHDYITSDTVLDGFTITGGSAHGASGFDIGGGLYCNGLGPNHACNATLSNLAFIGNSAVEGGALYDDGSYTGESSPTLINVTFSGNGADDGGGAMHNHGNGGTTSPHLTNVTFHDNHAGTGGAIYSWAQNGGTSTQALTNVTFAGNSASMGGAIYNFGVTATLWNAIMWGDMAGGSVSEIYNDTSDVAMIYSVVSGGCPGNTSCDIPSLSSANPLLGALASNGGFTPTLLPGAGSPAIDKGGACPATDQRGVPRPQGSSCDIGAVEVVSPQTLSVIVTGGGVVSAKASLAPISGGIVGCSSSGGPNCSAVYAQNLGVALTGTLAGGYVVWGGDCASDGTVTTTAARSCTATFAMTPTYTVGGSVTGLSGNGLQLQLGAQTLSVPGDGDFTFPIGLVSGSPYEVTVLQQPDLPAQNCTIGNGSGTIANAKVSNVAVSCTSHAVCYVNGAASGGTQDGSSWAKAYADLQAALGNNTCIEVRVAKGVYKPTATADQTISFDVRPWVIAVYGGFSGTETQRAQRNPAANLTVLSGDIDNNDSSTAGVDGDAGAIVGSNSYHVVVMDGTTASGPIGPGTTLDGFTITGGWASGDTGFDIGGGLYCNGHASGNACSPTLSRLVFRGNWAGRGGALFNDGANGGTSSPVLTRVVFQGNLADNDGGAMYDYANTGGSSNPTLAHVTFKGNEADSFEGGGGGAMFNDGSNSGTSSPVLADVTFNGNLALYGNGGAVFDFGIDGGTSSPTLTNVTLVGNAALGSIGGGAIYNDGSASGVTSPILSNVTFSGNYAWTDGGAMFNTGTNGSNGPRLKNVILWGDVAEGEGGEVYNHLVATTIDSSVMQFGCPGGYTCTNIITDDPLLGALADNGGFTQTLLPGFAGSAIDAATNCYDATNAKLVIADQRGIARPQGNACEIGAVEVSDGIFASGFDH